MVQQKRAGIVACLRLYTKQKLWQVDLQWWSRTRIWSQVWSLCQDISLEGSQLGCAIYHPCGNYSSIGTSAQGLQQCVLQRDIKSSNVLLDANFDAHLGDFGLVCLIDHEKMEKPTMMAGTWNALHKQGHQGDECVQFQGVGSQGHLWEVNIGWSSWPEDLVLVEVVRHAHEAGNLLDVIDSRLNLNSSNPNTISEIIWST